VAAAGYDRTPGSGGLPPVCPARMHAIMQYILLNIKELGINKATLKVWVTVQSLSGKVQSLRSKKACMLKSKVKTKLIRFFKSKKLSITNLFLQNKVNQAILTSSFHVFTVQHSPEKITSLTRQEDFVPLAMHPPTKHFQ
jgi:hypothetical protein